MKSNVLNKKTGGTHAWSFALALASLVTAALPASAAVNTVAYYRLGEDDPGAAAGQPANEVAVDSGGSMNLHRLGSALNSDDISVAGSVLSLEVADGGYTNGTPIITLTDNWGMEAWVRSETTAGARCIVYNGNSANSGMGLYQIDSAFIGLVGGKAFVGSQPIEPGTWVHLAMVVMNGSTTFYANGAAMGSGPSIGAPAGTFNLGIRPDGQEKFVGRIDEVRLFTFEPDQFVADDLLLVSVPPNPQPPVIVTGPTATPGTQVLAGDTLSLAVVAGGTAPLHFQWFRGTTALAGGTSATLALNPATTSHSGDYSVVVSNLFGVVTSIVAQVTVLPPGSSALITQAYYRLGEQDPGAGDGGIGADPTVDDTGSFNLAQVGNPPLYTSDTGVNGSTLGIAVDGGGYWYQGAVITQTDNWGIEAWVWSDSTTDNHCIAYNGNSANSGMGIYQLGGNFAGLAGGVAVVGGAAVVPGTWTHLALVVTGGQTTFYVNGAGTGTGPRPNPVDPTQGTFSLGIKYDSAEPFLGRIDEVRVFTVLPGHFSSGDLLLSRVPPGALPPFVVSGPTVTPGNTVLSGANVSFQVVAGGTIPLQFQWRHAGANLAGATNASLSLTNVSATEAGDYDIIIRNTYGAITSVVASVTVLPPGSATIAAVAYYRLGEQDPGAENGALGTDPTVDALGVYDLTQTGNPPLYSSDTGVNGSTLCLGVNGGGYWYAAPIFTGNDNWGIEAWVASDTTAENRCIAYNGNSSGRGMGLYQIGDRYMGLIGGLAFVGGAPITPGEWTHLALVVQAGTATFYVNGTSTGSAGRPNPPAVDDTFNLGVKSDGAEPFLGRIDEVRLFNVTLPGQFSPQDLLLTHVPPTAKPSLTITKAQANVVITWTEGKLQEADTPLGPWTPLADATSPWTITAPTALKKFYRAMIP